MVQNGPGGLLIVRNTETNKRALRAIVLAAGIGARMYPLTQVEHKSLLPIGNNTILGRIVDGLIDIDVEEIVIVTGYLADRIQAFLASRYPHRGFQFVHNARFRETNNIFSLAMALESVAFDRDILLIECDVLFKPEILRRLAASEPGNIALVDRYRTGMDGTVVSAIGGIVTQVYPTHLQTEGFDYSDKYKTLNIYRFDREFCRRIFQPLLSCYAKTIDSGCYYELVLGMLINMQNQLVRAQVVDGQQWAEVDDPNDLASARFAFEPEARGRILGEAWGGHWNFDIVDFAFIRNMYFPTDAMIAATRRALPELMRSYGSAQSILNRKLGLALTCNPDRVQCLNGASQIYPELAHLLPSGPVLLPKPTFGEYARWFPSHTTYADTPGLDFALPEREVQQSAIVVIVNPNNPTGTTVPTRSVYALASSHPATMFLVDESFIDFSSETSLIHLLELSPLKNVLVIASLSKSLGVPGLRLGYVYSCDSALIEAVGRRLPVWNSNSIAEHTLELLPKFRAELKTSFRRTAEDREQMADALRKVSGIETVYPSGANFLLVRLTPDLSVCGSRLAQISLTRHGVYLKNVSDKFADSGVWLRFAVRKPEENLRLAGMLSQILSELRVEGKT